MPPWDDSSVPTASAASPGTDLTRDLAFGLGRAAVVVLGRHGAGRPTFLIGRDTRRSGVWLEEALADGIRSAGGDVILAGVEPTPAIAFLTTELKASSGVVISASHNPPEDNGIKFFSRDGMKLSDDLEDEIEAVLAEPAVPAAELGTVSDNGVGRERYLEHLVASSDGSLDGMTLVVDCANGAASGFAPQILRRLGAVVHPIFDRPDGDNINVGCGALHPEIVAAEVVRVGADAGVAYDGDADRALFADARGNVIDGDQVLAACAIAMHANGSAPGRPGGHHGDGEPRLPSRDARRRHPGGRHAGRGPLRPRGDAPQRGRAGRRAVGARDLPGSRPRPATASSRRCGSSRWRPSEG